MRSVVLVLAVLALAAGGCGGGEPGGGEASTARTAEIYAAVVRRLLTEDTTFPPGSSPFARVFVVDGAVAGAGNPDVEPGSPTPFPEGVKQAVERELDELLPVEFVRERSSVVEPGLGGRVRDGGVLVTLGPIAGGGDRVTVPNSLYFANLGAQWLTYVLERADGRWQVRGTTGPRAIS